MSMPTTPSSRGASGGGVVPDGAHRATAASAAPTTRVPTGPYAPARSHGFVGASAPSAPRASATSAASAVSAPLAATAPRRAGPVRRAASPRLASPPYQAGAPQTPAPLARALVESIEGVVVGKREAVETTVATFLAGGHQIGRAHV